MPLRVMVAKPLAIVTAAAGSSSRVTVGRPPNIIILHADDLGIGDRVTIAEVLLALHDRWRAAWKK